MIENDVSRRERSSIQLRFNFSIRSAVVFEVDVPHHDLLASCPSRNETAERQLTMRRAEEFALLSQNAVQNPSSHPDLSYRSSPRKIMEVRMAIGVAADFVTLILHPNHELRILLGGAANDKECDFHCVIAKDVQHPRGMDRIRAVIDRDGNLRPVAITMFEQSSVGNGAEQRFLNQSMCFRCVPVRTR